jgi:hypothetical protein
MSNHPSTSPAPTTVATTAVRGGSRPEARRPYHVGVAIGLCAGVYAGSLTAVTVLQIDRDRDLIRDRAPVAEAIELLARHNDRMATEIDAAGEAFQQAADGYEGVAAGVTNLDTAVKRLTARVAAIKGSTMQLPDALSLPPVTRIGGGSSSSGGGSGGSVTKPKPKPAPPPTQGSTGASGG